MTPNKRMPARQIAQLAEGPAGNRETYRSLLGVLGRRGYVVATAGPSGGFWLTETGISVARWIVEQDRTEGDGTP